MEGGHGHREHPACGRGHAGGDKMYSDKWLENTLNTPLSSARDRTHIIRQYHVALMIRLDGHSRQLDQCGLHKVLSLGLAGTKEPVATRAQIWAVPRCTDHVYVSTLARSNDG